MYIDEGRMQRLMVGAVAYVTELNFQITHGTDRLEAAKRALGQCNEAMDSYTYAVQVEYNNDIDAPQNP